MLTQRLSTCLMKIDPGPENGRAVLVRAYVVAHHLALRRVAVDVAAEQRGRNEDRDRPDDE